MSTIDVPTRAWSVVARRAPEVRRRSPRVAARSVRGLGRADNQDATLVALPVLAVSDGVGGRLAGAEAAALTLDRLRSIAERPARTRTAMLEHAFAAANRAVRHTGEEHGTEGMAATLVAAVLDEHAVVVAHAGDSRAYVVRGGVLRRLTRDHSLVEELLRTGAIDEAEARRHPHRNLISRAIGLHASVRPDVVRVPTRPGDRLLLCSDGLSGPLSDAAIAAICAAEPAPERLVDELIAAAQRAGGHDDVSVAVAAL